MSCQSIIPVETFIACFTLKRFDTMQNIYSKLYIEMIYLCESEKDDLSYLVPFVNDSCEDFHDAFSM